MDNKSLSADDFEGIEPKPNSFELDNLVVVAFVALAKSKGMPKTEVIRKLQRRQDVVVDNEREREERDESLNDNPSLVNPSSFINVPKRKRSPPMREIVEPLPSTVPSILNPIDKIELVMMLEREGGFSVDAEFEKAQWFPPKKRFRFDVGCINNGENTRPMKKKKEEECGPVRHPDLSQNFKDKIQELNGFELESVNQKRLTKTEFDEKKYWMSVRSSKNPEDVVVDEERERGERTKSLNDEPSLPNSSSFRDIPKRKRSPLRVIVQPPLNTVSLLFPIGKEPKIEALKMIRRDQECFGVDVKGKKTLISACPRKRSRSDIGCCNNGGKKSRPMEKLKKKDCGPLSPPNLPQNFRDKIQALNGCELKLVIQKPLTISDVDKKKYRISIPIGEIRNEFLRSEENAIFGSRKEKAKSKGIEVELIEPSCERVTALSLRKWWMNKGNGNINPIYNLVNRNWYNKVVVDNGLVDDMIIQLWSFRVEGKLKFVLVKVDDGAAAGGGHGVGVGSAGVGPENDGGGESGINSSSGGRGSGCGSDQGEAHVQTEKAGQSNLGQFSNC